MGFFVDVSPYHNECNVLLINELSRQIIAGAAVWHIPISNG